jgi:cell division protein FtsI (penicillin-binding protein 3)
MVDRRLTWLAAFVLLWGAAIFSKLVLLQVVHHRHYAAMARARQELDIDIPAPRGTIFDRNGSPLAMSVPTEAIHVNPLKVPDLGVAADILSMVLRMDRNDLYDRMKAYYDNRKGYFMVKKKATFEEAERLRHMGFDWVDIDDSSERHYPKGALAAHVLGGVDFQERGNAGIEKALDNDLRGVAGHERLLTDVKRRGIDAEATSEPRPGESITLTIDERLQFVVERELAIAAVLRHAVSGSVVVLNPHNGDILALASYPPYDPNRPPVTPEQIAARANHAVNVPFEPGSVFKVVTLSAALETTGLRPDSLIDCGHGPLVLFGRAIHEHAGYYGTISMAQILAHSSNIGAIKIGMRVGQQNLYDYVRKFGFGQRTGITLPGESRGRLRKLSQWGSTSLASVSMGQEVSVTTVQLAQAAAVVANGGLRITPRLVLKKGDQVMPVAPAVRILRPETAVTMRQMMEGVVMPGGTAYPEARLAGYSVGGKTGSAQIFDFATHHYTHNYNGSFMGFAPLNNPAIVVIVTLNGTHGNGGFGGRAAAPVFHAVATEALRVMDVPKDIPEEPPHTLVAAKPQDSDDLAIAGLDPDGPNILEDPDEDGAPATTGPQTAGPKVPNFKGKTMRAVLAEAAQMGLTVMPAGSGVARVQFPPAGAALRQGERIRVRFAR